jgi:malate permease and related proteins
VEFIIIFKASILPVFVIVAVAFVYHRLFRPDFKEITNLALTVFTPVFVFDSLVKENITLSMLGKPIVFMVLLTAAMMIIAHIVATILRAGENERISLMLASAMINVGNFGLPLIYFTYGNNASATAVLYFVAFNVPLSTVAIYISSREKKFRHILKDIARIPIFYALILSLVVTQMHLPIPLFLTKSLGLLGQATIPLMIFILGLQLAAIRIKWRFITFIVPAVIIRLVLSPIIALVLFHYLGVTGLERDVATLQTSAPAALLPLMYAIRFNRAPDLLAATILTSTLLSGVTLTTLIHFLKLI